MSKLNLTMVLATDKNGAIGHQNKIPWDIPEELQYFKSVTLGHAVLMGRKTFESIGKALPNRYNIVLTSDESFSAPDVDVVNSYEEATQLIKFLYEALEMKTIIIGGATIYPLFKEHITKILHTKVNLDVEADTFVDLVSIFELPKSHQNKQWKRTTLERCLSSNNIEYTKYEYNKIGV